GIAMGFRYEFLHVWPIALEYVDVCFIVADNLPQPVQFSLGEPLRRAAISVIANIAEGSSKTTSRSERNFYDIARGSLAETVGVLALCERRSYVNDDQHIRLYNRTNLISSMFWGLIKANTEKKTMEEAAAYDFSNHSLDDFFATSSPAAPPRHCLSPQRLLFSTPHP
ncbi:MAG: four helix bundle protein, partial [Chloroflexales bacterium]|nr:four helix bundle protein [Chloroflexales bacterium]